MRVRPHAVVAAHFVVSCCISLVMVTIVGGAVELSTEIRPLCMAFTLLVGWLLLSWKVARGTLFDPYGLFLIIAILFNGGHLLLAAIGIDGFVVLGGQFSDRTIVLSIEMVSLGLASLHAGALVAVRPVPQRKSDLSLEASKLRMIRLSGAVLLCLSLPFLVLGLVEAVRIVLAEGYMGLYQRQAGSAADSAGQALAAYVLPGAFLLLVGSSTRRRARLLPLALVLVYSAILLFLGYRGHSLLPLIACAWLWDRSVRPMSRKLILAGAATLLFIVIPIVREARNASGSARLDSVRDAVTSLSTPAVKSVEEMGYSMRTVSWTLELVPNLRQFDLGLGYFYGALRVLPNLFWDRHPSAARGDAAGWLVATVEPVIARSGGGLGYSFIAEAYLNFSWFGVVAVLALVGFGFVRLVSWAEIKGHPERLAGVAAYLPSFLFYARAESSFLFRPLVWYGLLPLMLIAAIERLVRGRSAVSTATQPYRRFSAGSTVGDKRSERAGTA